MQIRPCFLVAALALAAGGLFAGCPSKSDPYRTAKDSSQALHARLAAVENLADQELLADVAKTAGNYDVCLAAAKKLDEQHREEAQSAFAWVANYSSDPAMRHTAFERLTEQAAFADVVKNTIDPGLRETAFAKLTDQAQLADVAKNAKYVGARRTAAEKLTDPALLADVAKNANGPLARDAAEKRLAELKEQTK